jgi:hypothetical protein
MGWALLVVALVFLLAAVILGAAVGKWVYDMARSFDESDYF